MICLKSTGLNGTQHSLTPYLVEHDLKVEDCVQQLRARVHQETGLTASAGIAPNVVRNKDLNHSFLMQ